MFKNNLSFCLQDSPDQGVLYLLKGLLNVLQNYPWETHTDTKCLLFVNVLSVLSATSQEAFIHHIDKGEVRATVSWKTETIEVRL